MAHLLLEKAEALFSSEGLKSSKQVEAARDFIAQFNTQPLWIPIERDEANNVGIATIEVDGQDRPVLLAFLNNSLKQIAESFGELELHEFPSVFVFALLQKDIEFNLCLVDGDDNFVIGLEQLNILWQLIKVIDSASAQGMTRSQMLAVYPVKFAKTVYQYCAQHRDIDKTWLGLLATSTTAATVVITLEGGNLAEHKMNVKALAESALSFDLPLLYPDDESEEMLNIKRALVAQAPLYTKDDRQDWIGAMYRFLFRPKVLIQMNLH